MQTDISLENTNRKIIIDTKYYQHALTQNFGSQKIISGNLYQIFAYLSNCRKAEGKETIGMLLYPKTGKDLDLSYNINAYPVKIMTVDLGRDWVFINNRLKDIISI
ncbi:5-methylcytosine restriction system specificity protein McrC [Cytobacillus firmus]|uniref:5-methylcytosine restriction system specificity protein McrC n=2 Tax=Bacillaceae TaxID=186817 RepID=UPI00272D580D|nr:hypothetical protein [Cytobacillus firmus]